MKYLLILFLSVLQYVATCQTSGKDELIVKLIDVQGTTETFKTVIKNMIELQKEQTPYLTNEFWEEISTEACKNDFMELKNLLKPIYAKYYSNEQLQDMISFYESETGKYLVEIQPTIINESMNAGAVWGENLGIMIYQKILETDEFKFNSEIENCEDFRTGKFKMILPDSSEIEIIRTDSTQIEIYQGQTYEYSIAWMSKCRFKIIEIGKGFGENTEDIIVNIYEANSDNCKIISKINNAEFYDKITMYKIE